MIIHTCIYYKYMYYKYDYNTCIYKIIAVLNSSPHHIMQKGNVTIYISTFLQNLWAQKAVVPHTKKESSSNC